ncbi:hypothetical protein BKA56DRAFT_433600, partial [Ilyonectria sp. MPI-CAGE-AT-0026]
ESIEKAKGSTRIRNTPHALTSPAEKLTGNGKETQASGTGFTTLTSPSSTAAGESIVLDLDDAILGEYASSTTIDGKTAMAPPNGRAFFTLNITKPLNIQPGELVRLIASIKVEEIGTQDRRLRFAPRGEKTDSSLRMLLDDASIYHRELVTTDGKFRGVTSEKTKSSKTPRIQIIQESGAYPVQVTVRSVKITHA